MSKGKWRKQLKSHCLTVRLDDAQYAQIKHIARRNKITLADVIRQGITEYLNANQASYDIKIASLINNGLLPRDHPLGKKKLLVPEQVEATLVFHSKTKPI